MAEDFNPKNAVAVSEAPEGSKPADHSFSIENAVSVDAEPTTGETPYDLFRGSNPSDKTDEGTNSDNGSTVPSSPKEGQPVGNIKKINFEKDIEYPHENFLNSTLHLAEGALWNSVAAPFHKEQPDMNEYLSQLEKKHPIASVVGGTAPFMATAAFFPESLVPQLYARMAAQFGLVGFTSALGKVKDQNTDLQTKAAEVLGETAKQAAFSPIYAKAQTLQILDRPFASALARAGVITGGNGVMSTFFGENITEAFKQGGVYGALSLIMESPHLAKTVLGRGAIARQNAINPNVKIDADSPNVASQVAQSAEQSASDIKGIKEPQIVSAAIKLSDGTEIIGATHEDALNKLGATKSGMFEYKGEPPEVSLEHKSGSVMNVRNKEGKIVGDVAYSVSDEAPGQVTDEGIDIDVDKGKGYGRATIGKVFDSGVDTIRGDVAKGNKQAVKFWTDIGGKLIPQSDTAYKLVLEKDQFLKAVGKEGNYLAGFKVLNPDGTTHFISKDEATKAPYNVKEGDPKNVPGLSEAKFMAPPEEPKIVNPQTLKGLKGEEGGIDVNLIPGVAESAEVLQKTHQELQEKLAPYTVGKEGEFTAATLRENLGVMARSHDMLEQALLQAKRTFDKSDKDSSLGFIYKMEEGAKQDTPELQKVANTLRTMLDNKRDEIRALGIGKLENFIENYFPHLWESPGKAGDVVKAIMGRRPFEGGKSFLKKRTIPTTKEGIESGLTPITYNPIDSVMLKIREMDRYLMAQRSIQALKKQGLIKFVRTGEKSPEGFVKIDDRFADVTYKNDAGELVLAGKYLAQKDAARILNNYLSPGLAGKSYIYDMYRQAGNTLNQFQLGISAFHLGFTSMDATISKFALGFNKLSMGDFAGAVKEFARTPFAPVTNILQGRELLQAWYGKDMGPLTNQIADVMATAGGRAKMDQFYATHAAESMNKALKEGKILTAALKVPYYIVDQVAKPIMEYIVPRQKLGVFMDMMKHEIESNPNMTHDQMRTVAQRAWDSVDNRMGQLVYDNLFWNKVTKDLGMASVRSLGWNLGTIREIGGGVKDVVGNIQDVIHGKATKMSYRTAYVMALPIVTGIYGAIYQYLHTGQGPQELKDYFFPKNGAIDSKGQDSRISFPTYMKDIYHYTTNPIQTVLNKFSPVNNAVMEMLLNKDFYGTQIRNTDDPVMRQVLDEAKFVGTQFVPFGFRNQNRDTRKTATSRIEPFIGLTPAPYDINMTKAEKEAYELNKNKIPVGSRTKDQAEHSKAKSTLRSAYMADKDDEPLKQAVSDGIISTKEKNDIVKAANMTPMQRATRFLTFEETMKVYHKANEEEKNELKTIIEKKRQGRKQRGTWSKGQQEAYDEQFKSEE